MPDMIGEPSAVICRTSMGIEWRGAAAEVFVHQAIAGRRSRLEVTVDTRLPGNPHLSQVDSYCNPGGTPFYFPSQSKTWARIWNSDGTAIPRRAGVSVYGFGGSSAHCILEEYIGHRAIHAAPPRWGFFCFQMTRHHL